MKKKSVPMPIIPAHNYVGHPPAKVTPQKYTKEQRRLYWGWLCILVIFTMLLEFFMQPYALFGFDSTPLFYGWFSLMACVLIGATASFLRLILQREAGYYRRLRRKAKKRQGRTA